jgi:hypothetical protein
MVAIFSTEYTTTRSYESFGVLKAPLADAIIRASVNDDLKPWKHGSDTIEISSGKISTRPDPSSGNRLSFKEKILQIVSFLRKTGVCRHGGHSVGIPYRIRTADWLPDPSAPTAASSRDLCVRKKS